jgi:hypothetical protein
MIVTTTLGEDICTCMYISVNRINIGSLSSDTIYCRSVGKEHFKTNPKALK